MPVFLSWEILWFGISSGLKWTTCRSCTSAWLLQQWVWILLWNWWGLENLFAGFKKLMALSPVLAELVGQDRVSCFFISLHLTQSFLSSRTCTPSVILHDMKVNIPYFYMVESQVGKMKCMLCSDWLPEWARSTYLARSGLPAFWSRTKNFCLWPYDKSFIDQTWSIKLGKYWPCSFLHFNQPWLLFSVHKDTSSHLDSTLSQ